MKLRLGTVSGHWKAVGEGPTSLAVYGSVLKGLYTEVEAGHHGECLGEAIDEA